MNVLPFEKRVQVISMLVEGNSIRSIERMTGINRNTIMSLGVLAGEACAVLHDQMIRGLRCPALEVDEIWTFVGKKQRRVKVGDSAEFGDQYTFVAEAASSKLAISYLTGKRNGANARKFLADVRMRVLGKPQITSDQYLPYVGAVDQAFGDRVHFAMLLKEFATDSPSNQAKHRYSPGRVLGTVRFPITGRPLKSRISTSFVERSNLTMRMSMRRFTRLTNAFSKKLRNLKAAVALHFSYYNLCRVHESLGMTPAMKAGLATEPWSIADLLATVLQARQAA